MVANKPPRLCQCGTKCSRPPLKGQPFCAYHTQHGCGVVSPLSGYEPNGETLIDDYNKDTNKRHTHNCYSFAVGYHDQSKIEECRKDGSGNCNTQFHVPGKKAGHPGFRGSLGKRCSDIVARTKADIPEATFVRFEDKCPVGMSKIGVVVDKKRDFHYYVQTNEGLWAHKPGGRNAINVDSEGSLIVRPDRASRFYPSEHDGDTELNYDKFCTYMCVPRTHPNVIQGGKRSSKTQKRATSKRQGSSKRVKKGSTSSTLRQRQADR
jgi:hypothetical protein